MRSFLLQDRSRRPISNVGGVRDRCEIKFKHFKYIEKCLNFCLPQIGTSNKRILAIPRNGIWYEPLQGVICIWGIPLLILISAKSFLGTSYILLVFNLLLFNFKRFKKIRISCFWGTVSEMRHSVAYGKLRQLIRNIMFTPKVYVTTQRN